MKANRKCPVLPLILTGIVAVFSLYGCSATRGVEKVSCHIEYDTAVTAEELNMDVENPIWTARGPRGYLRDTEEVTDVIRDDVNLICRYVFYWKKRLAKVYVYTWMEEGTPLKYIHFWYLGCPDLPAESRAEEYMIYPVLSTKLRTYYYDKNGNVTGMTDDLHLAGFRLCPRQVLYIGDRYTRRCRSRKNPESSVVPHQSPAEPKRWRYSFLDRKGNRWMLIINDATGKVISKKKTYGQ